MFRSSILLAAAALVCGAAAAAEPTLVIRGDHAATRAFGADVAKLFELKRGARARVEAFSTVVSLEAVAKGEVELAVSARGADPESPLEADLNFTPVAWDALALVTYPGNPVGALSVQQLHDVLTGKIKNWQELGGKPGAINLYAVAGPFDGVEYSLRRLVLGSGRVGTAAQRWYVNTVQLEAAIAIDPAGLGVSLLSDVAGNKELKVLAIEGVMPSSATISNGEYLLPTPLYAVSRGAPAAGSAASRWLEYLSDADVQKQLRARHLLPTAEAGEVAANAPRREAFLAQRLELTHIGVAALPPLPAPTKTTPLNAARLSGAETVHALSDKPVPVKGEVEFSRTTSAASDGTKPASCLEAPLC